MRTSTLYSNQNSVDPGASPGSTAEPHGQVARRALAASHPPAWARAGGDHPPAGLFPGQADGAAASTPPIVQQVLGTSGQALDPATRAFMEPRFGQDFGGVRVHTDGPAAASARAVGALAYTVGQDVVFGPGQFAPGTPRGQQLLAHELTHVLQNRGGAAPGRIQRYEAPEHQDFGDTGFTELADYLKTPAGVKWAADHKIDPQAIADLANDPILKGGKIKVGGLELTPGDVIALMGDFYRSPAALLAAPPAEVQELLAAIKRERAGELTGGQANALYQQITAKYRKQEDTFLELAKVNAPHFTPTNRAAWKDLHLEAIKKAPTAYQEALLIDAAGGHFLTDAFASGHLFDKNQLEIEILRYLRDNPARPKNPEVQGYYALSDTLGIMPQLVLKNIHDRLNAEGLDVTNKKGMKWKTFGDDYLKNAAATRQIGALAVYLSRRQITLAQQKDAPAPDPNEVLDLLPDETSVQQATAQAISYIPAAAAAVTDLLYRQRSGVKAGLASALPPLIGPVVGSLIQSNLETIASPGREKQLLDLKETERTTGIPQVAPSFTVFSWGK